MDKEKLFKLIADLALTSNKAGVLHERVYNTLIGHIPGNIDVVLQARADAEEGVHIIWQEIKKELSDDTKR